MEGGKKDSKELIMELQELKLYTVMETRREENFEK